MILWHRTIAIVHWILRRRRVEAQLDEELQAYLEMSAADKRRAGHSADDARRLALIELGGLEQAKERVRTYRHGGALDDIGRDLRHAVRMALRTPAFSALVVITLAIGVGINTSVFSLIEAVMLRRLPVPHADELVQVQLRERTETRGGESLAYATVKRLDEERDLFAGVAGFSGFSFEAGVLGGIDRVAGALVTGAYYDTLGLAPSRGRLLTRDDDRHGAPLVAVISDGYWARRFSRSTGTIGAMLLVNRVPVTIVGITPRGFDGTNVGSISEVTLPVSALPVVRPGLASILEPGTTWLRVLARPRPGVSVSAATARLNGTWQAMSASLGGERWDATRRAGFASSHFVLTSGSTGWTDLRDTYGRSLFILMVVAGVVLIIACANVANLLIARSSSRVREVTVRLALGASRFRILRQLLFEGLVLSMAGARAGTVLASACSRFVLDLIASGGAAVNFDTSPNWSTVLFALALGVVTGALFTLLPALQLTARPSLTQTLRQDARTQSSRSRWLPRLVTLQVALSLVLVAGGGLLVKTLRNLQSLDTGFSTDGVVIARFDRQRLSEERHLLDAVRALPEVSAASLADHIPLGGSSSTQFIVPEGQPWPTTESNVIAAGPGLIDILGIPRHTGRDFTDRDTAYAPRVAIVNESYRRRYLPGVDPIGRRLLLKDGSQQAPLEIIGVVGNTRAARLRDEPVPTVYLPYAQAPEHLIVSLVVRVRSAGVDAEAALRRTLHRVLPTAAITVRPLAVDVSADLAEERLMATLAAVLGGLALGLACIGLHGLLAFDVARRTREIGIRMALGSPAPRVVATIVGRGALPVLTGIALGLPLAWMASQSLESLLFGLTSSDPAVFGAAVTLMAVAAAVAVWMPASRASRVDPLTALRSD